MVERCTCGIFCNAKEETLSSLLAEQDSQRMSNPYVIISAIENYSSPSKRKGI